MPEERSILARTGMIPHVPRTQHSKGKTITTNTTNTVQGITPTNPPVSNWAVAAVTFLILGFFTIALGLFATSILLYTTILGGSLILAASTLAILSLRDLL